jgi:membrane protease YdiL (CAAX protease family)
MPTTQISRKAFYSISVLALVLFIPLFIFRQLGPFDFWWWMSSNLVIMISLSLILDKRYIGILKEDFTSQVLRKILLGLTSAIALYALFWAGNFLSRQWFDFAGSGIEGVYNFKGDASFYRIMLFMVLIIGPGEEIFWRGVLQRWFADRLGGMKGYLLATLFYTAVHVFSGNIMLIVAAFVAGAFWGWMYWRYKSLLANVVSHTVWDIAVFLVFPFVG